MRILRGGVERKMLFGLIVFGDRRARLHRIRHQPVVGDVERDHIGGRLEGGILGGFVADGPVIDHVARRFRMQLRRARLDRGADVGGGRQFLVVDRRRLRRASRAWFWSRRSPPRPPGRRSARYPAPSPATRPSSSAVPSLEVIIQPQIRLPILSSTICWPVRTATTPGIFIAAAVSMLLTLAWACGLRTKWAWVMPCRLDIVDVAALAGDETACLPCARRLRQCLQRPCLCPPYRSFAVRRFHRNRRS